MRAVEGRVWIVCGAVVRLIRGGVNKDCVPVSVSTTLL